MLVKVLRKIYKNYRGTGITSDQYHKNFRTIAHAKLKICI